MGEVKGHETYHSLVLGIGAAERWTIAGFLAGCTGPCMDDSQGGSQADGILADDFLEFPSDRLPLVFPGRKKRLQMVHRNEGDQPEPHSSHLTSRRRFRFRTVYRTCVRELDKRHSLIKWQIASWCIKNPKRIHCIFHI